MVGVGEAVNVVVGRGEGVAVSTESEVIGKLVEVREGGEGWHAAIVIKTSAVVLWKNRQTHCFIK